MKTALSALLVALAPAVVAAQQPGTPVVPPPFATIPIGTRVGQAPSGYDDGGRRDPFSSLIQAPQVAAGQSDGPRGRVGLSGMVLADILVRGIVRSPRATFAILEGPNKQSFVARVGDRLIDASVNAIDANGVVFTGLTQGGAPGIQVRKALRAAAGGVR